MGASTNTGTASAEFDVRSSADVTADPVLADKHIEPEEKSSEPSEIITDAQENAPSVPQPAPGQPVRSKTRIALIMFALGMAVFLAAIDTTIITTALPTISEHFQSSAGYTWIGSAYMLAASASMPIWGKISDIWGRKPILLLANVVFCIGSLLAALSINVGMIIIGRAIQGTGGGGLIVLVNIAISDLFSMATRSVYLGVISLVWALASALGPILGGTFTEKLSWRWCFYINLPLDGAAFIIIFLFLDLHTPKTPLWEGLKAIDWLGAITIVGGTIMLLLGLQFGGVAHPWSSAIVICLIIFGVLTIGLYFLIEWKVAVYPIMPLRIFKQASNIATLGVSFFHALVFMGVSYFLPLYFQAVMGARPLISGVYLLATAFSLSITSVGSGIVIRKTGHYLACIIAGLTVQTLGCGLFINLNAHSSMTKVILFQVVAGLGTGPNFQAPLIAIQNLVDRRDIAAATATFGFIRNLATSCSIVIGGVVFQNEMNKHSSLLRTVLGPEKASQLGGANAGANIAIVATLPPDQQIFAREVFANSLSKMWIMYNVFAGLGLICSFFIVRKKLSEHHIETKTGLDQEKERKRIMEKLDVQQEARIGDEKDPELAGGDEVTSPSFQKEIA